MERTNTDDLLVQWATNKLIQGIATPLDLVSGGVPAKLLTGHCLDEHVWTINNLIRNRKCAEEDQMADDWFRNKTWSPEIEEAFQAKLKRARSQGPQYLYIQALTFADEKPEVALALLKQYFSTGDTFHVGSAYSVQAEAYRALGRYDDAIAAYRRTLLWESTHRNQLTRSYLEFPYLLAILGRTEDFEEAITILHAPEHKLIWPIDEFLYGASMALIHQKLNCPEQAIPYAAMALNAAEKERSPFWKHPAIGVVGSSYAEVLSQMREMAY